MQEILKYLKTNGEKFDSEIAAEVKMSLASVKQSLSELSAKGEVIMCHSIQFRDGKRIEGMRCRLAGFVPPAGPGRKEKARTVAS
jgi:hypothetical protein